MTQLELAEKLHYSDKSVSKWERGDSVPEIGTLTAIADMFGVSLDYLVREEHNDETAEPEAELETADLNVAARKRRNHAVIVGMSVLLAWFVGAIVFVFIDITFKSVWRHWLIFIWCVPVSMIIWLVFNSIWFNRRRNYLIISLLVWSALLSLYFTVLTYHYNIWPVFTPGIPAQVIILLWSMLSFKH